ncbi:MAG: hypothetical protein KME21_21920 [Desmonostoc vinosum HA7617-LM4]|jgi:hypothetical protein|nr:hypothetical protein [Desmonostoc vinosum HA7617-LM4]
MFLPFRPFSTVIVLESYRADEGKYRERSHQLEIGLFKLTAQSIEGKKVKRLFLFPDYFCFFVAVNLLFCR